MRRTSYQCFERCATDSTYAIYIIIIIIIITLHKYKKLDLSKKRYIILHTRK